MNKGEKNVGLWKKIGHTLSTQSKSELFCSSPPPNKFFTETNLETSHKIENQEECLKYPNISLLPLSSFEPPKSDQTATFRNSYE